MKRMRRVPNKNNYARILCEDISDDVAKSINSHLKDSIGPKSLSKFLGCGFFTAEALQKWYDENAR